MNNDLKPAIKKSLILGIIGAVLLPLMYEAYANISGRFAVIVILIWAFVSGILLSPQRHKNAFVAIITLLAITYGGALVMYMLLHSLIKSFLESVSTYFELSIYQSLFYWAAAIAISLFIFIIYLIARLVFSFATKQKGRGEKLKNDIDNAFDEP